MNKCVRCCEFVFVKGFMAGVANEQEQSECL